MIILLAFPAFKGFVIFTDFQLNRDAIAAENCINIEVDEQCKGTCHLVKEIKKENPDKKKTPFSTSNNQKVELLYFESPPTMLYSISAKEGSFYFNQNLNLDAHLMDVFHPPQSSVLS